MACYSYIKKSILGVFMISGASVVSAETIDSTSTISVSGNIISSMCAISASDLSQVISLGDVSSIELKGGIYTPVYFNFNIYGCESTLSTATATVTGTAVDSNVPGYGSSSVLGNTGTAGGVAVGMLGKTSVSSSTATGELPLGMPSAELPLVSAGDGSEGGVLNLGAQIIPVSVGTKPTPGTVIATATINFTYS